MGSYLGISGWQFPDFGGFASSRTGQILLGGLAGAILGAAISANLKVVVLLIGLVLGGFAVAAALTHPERAFIALVMVMVLIPTYAAPKASSLLFIPAAGLSWLLAGFLAWRNAMQRGRPFSLTGIDLLVVLFFILLYVSLQFSPQVEFKSDFLNNIFAWLGPFLAARLLLQDCKNPVRVIATAFAAGLVVIAPVAVLETLGVKNPFFNFQFNSSEAAAFGNAVSRLGQVRAQASFGHPIALSMFASASALLSLGMAIYSSVSKERLIWLGLAALGVGIQALTVSRTGWLMLVFGVVLLGLTTSLRAARKRLTTIFAIAGVALLVLSVSGAAPKELQIIPSSSGVGEEARQFQDSGAYRERLIARAFEGGVLGLWGNPYNKVSLAVSTTNQATDNAYIILADSWGLIPTFSLVAIAAALLIAIALARKREANELVILPITALMSLCALFFVAFITQQQVMIWLLIGAASAGSERALRRRREARKRTAPANPPPAPPQRLEVIPERW
ncbi:MAG: hypothetical protein QOE56_1443 [Solirubrobacterales bacterium]|jgi:hypothetical protein|nr:hypothetical protein [Solirubrobacterales bacterium]